MWFDIIKETEEDRLRALGYPVPEKPKSNKLTRDKIIEEIKNWANNNPNVSPFEKYFMIVESSGHNRKIPAKNKTAVVVEKTSPNTRYFEEKWTDIAYDPEDSYRQYRKIKTGVDDPINDTYVDSFYVGFYEIGNNSPIKYFGVTNIEQLLENLEYNTPSLLPKIRAGGLYADTEHLLQEAGIDANISNSGLLWVTGPSGNRYMVDFSTGDCKVTVSQKEIEFVEYPELNRKISLTICTHVDRSIPLGDRYVQVIRGLTNDTSPVVPNIIKLVAIPWKIKTDKIGRRREKLYYQVKLGDNIYLTEGDAMNLLEEGGNVMARLPW